jgi:hypothetical protein
MAVALHSGVVRRRAQAHARTQTRTEMHTATRTKICDTFSYNFWAVTQRSFSKKKKKLNIKCISIFTATFLSQTFSEMLS